ncbi:eukaryotic translation initiation factor 3 subunit b [Nicotiana attenuata]|uniref:Eukaryotic translation initiation factor 3 subunit B n=1 Tax=Nicotiana attenuata TaxID=49451 RepID=A0A1J6K622_NICAT|nr:eukaryotic translation initiation factor 3 subunit b [Nicotiana attenuata]
MDFSWSPADPILALFVPECENQPARVSLAQIPSKEELRQKNLFSVSDCKMYWQSNGDYLAVKVDRYTKTKKNTYTGFELFRIKERDIPIEVLELDNKNDKIIAFAWEPKGHRFAVIHGDNPRPEISFYSVRSGTKTSRVSKLTTLKGKQANALYWSPGGRFLILAGLKGFNGQLEFFDVDELETMASAEHFMATDVEWDPTGRYVATSVTSVHEMENGFNIWSFNGKLLYRILKDHFLQNTERKLNKEKRVPIMVDVTSMGEITAIAARIGVDRSQIDLDSIHVPPGEDCGIPSDDDDLMEEDPLEFDTGFGNILVVDNLPVVPKEKFEKLEGVVRKIYSQLGVIKEDGLWMPVDPEAELSKEKTHGYKLDRSHIFVVNMFDDIEKFLKVPDEWAPPEIKPYVPGENLQQWLADEKARDQFVIRAGNDTEVLWNDARQLKPELVYKRSTESFVQWSPPETYLATVHRQGAAIWGGATTFNRLMRYAHPHVKLIDFSPGERYLVTYSSHEPSNPRDTHRVVLNIFDVRTGKVMRDFKGSADEFAVGGTGGVTGWSPADPILALFVPECGNQPARVSLVQIPSKEELRQKNLFSVSDCKMYWQSNGDYLAVKVDRYTKTKKSTYTGFELFRIKERDIPIEVLELDNKNDKIIAFAWEPKGHRFAVIHGDNPRPDISFYSVRSGTNTGRVSKLTTLKGKQANALYWSPGGRFLILAGLKGFNGQLEFFDVDELETMASAEHFMATDVEWDPTGRYVATSVTSVHEMENGFNIWSFNGKLLYRILKDHFFQYLWRPRPPSFLSKEKEEEIAKNLKRYSKKYEAEDQDVSLQLSEQDREKRKKLKEEWEAWINEWKRLHEEEKMEREKLRDGEASDEEEEYEAKEVEVEEIINVTEEIIPFEESQQ